MLKNRFAAVLYYIHMQSELAGNNIATITGTRPARTPFTHALPVPCYRAVHWQSKGASF